MTVQVIPVTDMRRFLQQRAALIRYVTDHADDPLEQSVAEELLAAGLIDTTQLAILTGEIESRYE